MNKFTIIHTLCAMTYILMQNIFCSSEPLISFSTSNASNFNVVKLDFKNTSLE